MIKSKAFTLAEVLITLVIIGVIAAMTIPTLMGNTNDQKAKSQVRKTYSAINQAIRLDLMLYGTDIRYGSDENNINRALKNHLSVVQDNGNCFVTADGVNICTGGDGAHVWFNSKNIDPSPEQSNACDGGYNPDLKIYEVWVDSYCWRLLNDN